MFLKRPGNSRSGGSTSKPRTPTTANPVCGRSSAGAADACANAVWPSTTRELPIASASTASFDGRALSFARVSSSRPWKVSAASAGELRSASANTTSKPIATAPICVTRVTISATMVRGHGHWPSALRLSSSMSMMTTGRWVATRGAMSW